MVNGEGAEMVLFADVWNRDPWCYYANEEEDPRSRYRWPGLEQIEITPKKI
jgi:hypothetical protein